MSKMTTEQFLSHLGIEVGKPFREDEFGDVCDYIVLPEISFTPNFPKPLIINYDDHLVVYHYPVDTSKPLHYFELSHLLDCEITPLPKYPLTEEDKSYVSITQAPSIRRDLCHGVDELFYKDVDRRLNRLFIKRTMFSFINVGEEVPLDELRKCL